MNKMYAQLIHGLTYRGGMTWLVDPDPINHKLGQVFIPYKSTKFGADPDVWLVQHKKWTTAKYNQWGIVTDKQLNDVLDLSGEFIRQVASGEAFCFGASVSGGGEEPYLYEFDVSVMVQGRTAAMRLAALEPASEYIWNPINKAVPVGLPERKQPIVIDKGTASNAIRDARRHAVVY
jgi:hypothetical protein